MHICAKCSRANPADAVYCYFDGVALGGLPMAAAVGVRAFTAPLALPGGRMCQNFDQLALGCQENWSGAVEALAKGILERFLAGQGRADLAQAAREAARYPDRDRGLDQFLAQLPSQALRAPQLAVEPAKLDFGPVAIGSTRSLSLQMRNQGMRLIYGSVSVENAPWLTLGSGAGTRHKLFQFGSELAVPLTLQGKRLRAGNKPLEGKLVIESNAGTFTIPVRADVPVKPFPNGCLTGARSPRQVAERAKAQPKEAAPLFENGAVAQWYRDNGWTYPVKGAAASGLGAVQQFFEALGLTPPPKVEVSHRQVALHGQPGDTLPPCHLEVKAQEKRPVYAHATTDQPWLEVGRARLSGRVATIPLRVASVPARAGETLSANVTVTANGNQRFVIPVSLTVASPFAPLTPLVDVGGAAKLGVTKPGRSTVKRSVTLLPLMLLLLGLCGVMTFDLLSGKARGGRPPEGDPFDPTPRVMGEALTPYDREPRLAIGFTEETQKFGISILKLRHPLYPEKPKLLHRNERGDTNNTVVRIDGHEYVFGRESAGVGIRWLVKNGRKQKEVRSADGRRCTSTMRYENERIEVTQIVELVIGQATRLYDTVLVSYEVQNFDTKVHTVGVRAMIDTFIGAEDGTPFTIPPTADDPSPKLVDTMITLEKPRIPHWVRVLENSDIGDRNTTVAELGLKIRGFEDLNRVVICQWPQDWGGGEARWEWPYEPMNKNADRGRPKDSCVVLYWSLLGMNPGEKRVLGYSYGLGRIERTGVETLDVTGKGKIRLFLAPGLKNQEFVATTYVKGGDGQQCTLKLPPGIALARGESAAKPVRTDPGKDYAVVAWRVVPSEVKSYTLESVLDNGANDKATAEVLEDTIWGRSR